MSKGLEIKVSNVLVIGVSRSKYIMHYHFRNEQAEKNEKEAMAVMDEQFLILENNREVIELFF